MISSNATHSLTVENVGPVPVTFAECGEGRPFVLLHGGGGPGTVSPFAELMAESKQARVFTPTHPGFGGTPRPEGLTSVRGLAQLYNALLDELDLNDVTVVGNSMGGWIAAEMGLLPSPRISSIVLVDAVGIEVPDHPVADFFALSMDQVTQLAYHDPDKFRINPSALPAAQQAVLASTRAALALYAGRSSMVDLTLRPRLAAIAVPVLVLWGDSDQIVDPDYGRAFAQAIPTAQFELLSATGHLPQIETPRRLLSSIWDFTDKHATLPRR